MIDAKRLEALEALLEMLAINARQRDLVKSESATEFEGQTFLRIDGIYTGKAQVGDHLTEGLLVEGVAASWSQDREDESFAKGAFDRGLEKVNARGGLPLMYAHSEALFGDIYGRGKSNKLQLGIAKKFWKDPARGLMMQAFIPRPSEGHPILQDIYDKIARGEMRGLSVGGKMRAMMGKIVDTDLAEVSVAPVPINGDAFIHRVERVGAPA